jgi:hypothetical protein
VRARSAVPEGVEEVASWFQALSARVGSATDEGLRDLIREAQKFDLVGLSIALGEAEALAVNRAATALLEAAIVTAPAQGPRAHLLSVLRDILDES